MKHRVISIGLLLAMLLSFASPMSAVAADVSEDSAASDVTVTTELEGTQAPDLTPEPEETGEPAEAEPSDTPDAPEASENPEVPEEPTVPDISVEVPSVEDVEPIPEIPESPKRYAESEEKEIQTITGVKDTYKAVCGAEPITLQPVSSGDGEITFASSNTDVAVVGMTTGKVTFRNAGTAVITITAGETETFSAAQRTVTITVVRAKQTITGVKESYKAVCGDEPITLQPKTSGNGAITFVSDNTDVASVGKTTGKVTFRNAGTAVITITAGKTPTCSVASRTVTITVARAKQTITGVKEAYKATYGDAAITLHPKASGNGALTFRSDNTEVATVGKTTGKVAFRKAGTAVLTITAGQTDTHSKVLRTVKVTVTRAKQTISGVSAKYSRVYKPGGTFTLRAKSSADGTVTYQSSDTNVITVNKTTGKVTLRGAGAAVITVTASMTDNYLRAQKTIRVAVTKAPQTILGVAGRYEKNYVTHKSFLLQASTNGDGILTYQSSDPAIAAVGKTSGKVTLKKRGTCTITVTAPATGNYQKAAKKVELTLYKRVKTLKRSKYYKKSKYCKRLKALKLSDTNRRNILEIARSQLGYHEGNRPSQMDGSNKYGSGNYTEYGNYYGIQGAWCAMFVNWCARENAISIYKIPSTCRVMDYYSFFHKRGQRYYSWPKTKGGKKGSYTPKAGDLILYSTRLGGPTHHIGYVSGCTVKKKTIVIKTLEGNTSNEAREKVWTLKRGSSGYVSSFGQYINGFASPRY